MDNTSDRKNRNVIKYQMVLYILGVLENGNQKRRILGTGFDAHYKQFLGIVIKRRQTKRPLTYDITLYIFRQNICNAREGCTVVPV